MSGASVLPASAINGTQVTNRDGEDLGKIEELVIDVEYGRILYAILSFGGFMGMGSKWFAIPWMKLEPSSTEKKFALEVTKESLESAGGFDKDNWPEMDRNWGKAIYEHYGVDPAWEGEERTLLERTFPRR